MRHALVVRLDSAGDVLLAGPAVRAAAAAGARVTLLVSPDGEAAAALLPEVAEVMVRSCPWTGFTPPPVDPEAVHRLIEDLRRREFDCAIVLTSDHQSPLPMALLLRLAEVERIVATSHDYPGSLLSVRHPAGGPHEVQRNLSLVAAAGFPVPSLAESSPSTRLAVRQDLPDLSAVCPDLASLVGRAEPYVVLHAEASVPARSLEPQHAGAIVAALAESGSTVVVTGRSSDPLLDPAGASRHRVVDLTGHTTFPQLAAVLRWARCVVAVNTGPAHLAAAVGTPVVSLFAPVVPAEAWRPWGVPHVLLGDLDAACAGTRARTCPLARHTCLSNVSPAAVVEAVASLCAEVAA